MSDLVNPPQIIFCNDDLSANVEAYLISQLQITATMSGSDFDTAVAANPNFTNQFKLSGGRLLVIRSLREQTNRQLADIVLFIKAGLASVLYDKSGHPTRTLPIVKLTLATLLNTKNYYPPCDRQNLCHRSHQEGNGLVQSALHCCCFRCFPGASGY